MLIILHTVSIKVITFLSYSLSNISLIMHAEERIKNDPAPKRANILRSGKQPACAANPIDHVQGQYNSHVPAITSL